MAWKDTLQDASFRGYKFQVLRIEDDFGHELSRYAYPNVNGADFTDEGLSERSTRLTAIVYGDAYETDLKALLSALSQLGYGELIHPIFGSMQQMQVERVRVTHQADRVDTAFVDMAFVEATTSPGFFDASLPLQKSEAAAQLATTAASTSTSLFSKAVGLLTTAQNGLKSLNALRDNLNDVVSSVTSVVSGFERSALDYLAYPSAFTTDITSLLSSALDLRAFDGSTLAAEWSDAVDQFSTIVKLPTASASGQTVTIPGADSTASSDTSSPTDPYIPGGSMTAKPNADDVTKVTAVVQSVAATQLASTASDILANEIDTPTLTPNQIEQIVDDTRQFIQDTIDTARSVYDIDDSRPVTEALADLALSIQELGQSVINALPPLIEREVTAPCNVTLLAFKWYGDATRSDELLRLNPTMSNPNFINRGDVLYAFAE